MGISVQFWGKESVLQAYQSRDVAAWSLWQGSAFLNKCETDDVQEGVEKLSGFLNMLSESTNAIYTLKIYEELPSGKIKRDTKDDGSFNFRLNAEGQIMNRMEYQSTMSRKEMETKIAALEAKIELLEDELDEVPESGPDMWERINGLLEKPAIVGAINKLLGTDLKPGAAVVSGVPLGEEKLVEAIEILRRHDPRMIDHLWKLAQIAEKQPNNFSFFLSTLDSLVVP